MIMVSVDFNIQLINI